MLEFANRPPRDKDDVSLSEAGKTLLELAAERGEYKLLIAYGRAAKSEIIDAFGENVEANAGKVTMVGYHVIQAAAGVISEPAEMFAQGMNDWAASRMLTNSVLKVLDAQEVAKV